MRSHPPPTNFHIPDEQEQNFAVLQIKDISDVAYVSKDLRDVRADLSKGYLGSVSDIFKTFLPSFSICRTTHRCRYDS